jgi:hypothetical protein
MTLLYHHKPRNALIVSLLSPCFCAIMKCQTNAQTAPIFGTKQYKFGVNDFEPTLMGRADSMHPTCSEFTRIHSLGLSGMLRNFDMV